MNETLEHQARLRRVFEAWDAGDVRSCVWKSADRWQDGVTGRTDVDVLIDPSGAAAASRILCEQGWLPVRAEAWRRFPGVTDFLFTSAGVIQHLHVHENIVTGEKLTKSLRPPLTELYLASRAAEFPPIVSPALELSLLIPRIIIKLNLIDYLGALRRRKGAAVFRRYVGEYRLLKAQCTRADFEAMLDTEELAQLPKADMAMAYDDLETLPWSAQRRIAAAVAPWRVGNPAQRLIATLQRSRDKRKNGVGKRLPYPGLNIAIIGPDGSGKSSLAAALVAKLGRHYDVERFYLGTNRLEAGWRRRLWRSMTWWPHLVVRKGLEIVGAKSLREGWERRYLAVDASLARRDKMEKLAAIPTLVQAGGLAICERYPLFAPYGDDATPSIDAPSPDLIIRIDADLEEIQRRRPQDDPNLLAAKLAAFQTFAAREPTLSLASTATVAEWVTEIADVVHARLQQRGERARNEGESG